MSYIIQTIAFQLLFLVIYDFFLKKETFFNWNRAYLLATPLLSLVLPFIKLERFKTTIPQDYVFLLPEVTVSANATQQVVTASETIIPSLNVWQWIFTLGCILSFAWFVYKLSMLFILKSKGKINRFKEYTQIEVPTESTAFSFFKNIFIGSSLLQKEHRHIIAHELVHIKEKHSWDLIFFEILRIVFWFNPLVYIYQKRVTELHEFIADAKTVKNHKKEHFQLMLQEAFQTENISFVNQFFNHSLLKKRIVMLQKSKSKKVWQLKYLLLVPLVVGMLFYTSCESESHSENDTIEGKEHTILFDKYYDLIQERLDKGESIYSISSEIIDEQKNIDIKSKEEYYKSSAVMYHVFQSFKKEDQENLKETAERIKNKTYQEYLDFANSPEGKEQRYLSSLPKYSYGKDGERLDKQEFIPFTVINKKPRFTACDNVPEKEQFNCFKEKLDAHVRATFKYPEEAQDAGIQGRVYINFRINTDGSVTILNTRAPSPILDAEGRRIIESLPTLIPGKDASGTPKPVTFAYPIVFKLNADDTNNSQ